MNKPHIIVDGMQGLGDNLHQRAVIRDMMRRHVVWLKTPWPSVYHDLVGPSLRLLKKNTALRTQRKNQEREAAAYSIEKPPVGCDTVQVLYTHDGVRTVGTFLGAMLHQSNVHVQPSLNAFHLPVPDAWVERAQDLIDSWGATKPIMIYRPTVERSEWAGNAPRNPDPRAYADLAKAISSQFFVVSLADLSPGVEWATSPPIHTDVQLENGQLDFETMAGLFYLADLIYTAPGFALILAQAIGTRVVSVFGGHESARFYDYGARHHYFVQPTNPCECFRKDHACDKTIPFSAKAELRQFLAQCDLLSVTPV